ncbi:MAG: type II toxin-antitoxin system RelE/ParE family toxin [Candidatus Gastranaerophilales bacterium]
MKKVKLYKLKNGTYPFEKWYFTLDKSIRINVDMRLERLALGNYGNHKTFDNITELKLTQGAGYRIYTTEKDNTIIVLLCAGDKSTQANDIKKAKAYLEDVKNNDDYNEIEERSHNEKQ